MFVELHIIQTLPPSNPNRGRDGSPKNSMYGGSLRARLSSQSQKRAARLWYREHGGVPREHLADRSRQWADELATMLVPCAGDDALLIARIVLGLFNVGPDKILGEAMEPGGNLLFLSAHEIATIAAIAEQHQPLLLDLAERCHEMAELGTAKKYDRHPTKKEIGALIKQLGAISSAIPGDVAVFGRMMAQLTEASVDGCVQVADALSVNAIPRNKTADGWMAGEVDFFSAVDDRGGKTGAGMIGERAYVSPTYYRYANICTTELIRLVGDAVTAQQFAAGFLRGFIMALPDGMVSSHAHMTVPEAIIVRTCEHQPYCHTPAFLSAINEPDGGGASISQRATMALLTRMADTTEIYGTHPVYVGKTGLPSHIPSALPLDNVLDAALAHMADT
jgi:CRISPR system Cascade subunit CasC